MSYKALKGWDGDKFKKARRERAEYAQKRALDNLVPPTEAELRERRRAEAAARNVRMAAATGIARNDQIRTSDGKVYRVQAVDRGNIEVSMPGGRIVRFSAQAVTKVGGA